MEEKKNISRKKQGARLLHQIMKTTQMYKILLGFVLYFFITALVVWLVDPSITSLGDSLWFCFASCTTLGFGDIVVTSVLGKILTAILTVYGILLVGFIPGVLVSYFTEINKMKANKSVTAFLEKLEHLDELSEQEIKELAQKIRDRKYKS